MEIKIGKKIPLYDNRAALLKLFQYYFRAFKADRDYVRGSDDLGENIIHKHACELKDDYKNRKKRAIATPVIGSIIQKYNSIVYRNSPERAITNEELLRNIDLKGSPIDFFMKSVLLEAQIIGVSHVLLNYSGNEAQSVAQQKAANSRFWWQHIPFGAILNMEVDSEGTLEAILISFGSYAMYYDANVQILIGIDDNLNVTSIDEPINHGYEGIPVSQCAPQFAYTSQAAPLVDSQRKITNLESLLDEEIYENVFTRWMISGDIDADDRASIVMGSKRMLVTPAGTSISKVSSDASQSATLMEKIKAEEEKAFKLAGVKYGGEATAPESGFAKMIESEQTYIISETLSLAIEQCENYLLRLMGEDKTVYSRSYSSPDWGDEITQLRDILALEVPEEAKQNAIYLFRELFNI